MNQFSYKNFYRRNLPHIQPEGATLFITFRLTGSLSVEILERLRQEKADIDLQINKISDMNERAKQFELKSRHWFDKWDESLDTSNTGENHLSNPQIADMVAESLHYRNNRVYDLIAFCIMPNHAHLVCAPLEEANGEYFSLSKIMHSLKRHTARQANLILERNGAFWQHENYDHYARDEAELERIIKYVLYNPVKAGLVKEQKDWKWTYCKYNM